MERLTARGPSPAAYKLRVSIESNRLARPWCIEEMADSLGVKTDSVRHCVKRLLGEGVIRRFSQPGRRLYESVPPAPDMASHPLHHELPREIESIARLGVLCEVR